MATDPTARIYWADGAGSHAVFTSLRSVLQDLRATLLGNRAIALYCPTGTRDGYFVLSDSCEEDGAAIGNERLTSNQPLDLFRPGTVSGLELTSTLRHFTVTLGSAVSIPWEDAHGRGVALIGIQGPSPMTPDDLHQTEIARLVDTLDASRLRGTVRLQRSVSSALRAVLDEGSATGRVGRLTSLITSARQIFDSDTAYLALPDEPDTTKYYFASMANVNTPQFRQLRMRFEQGLGGLARTEGQVVRSARYADDLRLKSPPVSETLEEGISSAMAAPLMTDGDVRGVLYVGNRTPTPFSETDELVLEEFADYVALLMGDPGYQGAIQASRSTRLREDFAHAIHDSVVRSLVQIGFTAEQAAATVEHDAASRSIARIQEVAEDALTHLREELQGLTLEPSGEPTTVGAALDQITQVPVRPGVARNVYIDPSTEHQRLPHDVVDVLAHVGAEALTNSLRHSEARTERVEIVSVPDRLELVVADDGCGTDLLELDPEDLTAAGHFGASSMHRRAAAVNGRLYFTSVPKEGTTVHLHIPRTW